MDGGYHGQELDSLTTSLDWKVLQGPVQDQSDNAWRLFIDSTPLASVDAHTLEVSFNVPDSEEHVELRQPSDNESKQSNHHLRWLAYTNKLSR
jgi:hypothetical protein